MLNEKHRALERFCNHAPLNNLKSKKITQMGFRIINRYLTEDESINIHISILNAHLNNDRTIFDRVMLKTYRRLLKNGDFKSPK